MYAHGFRIYFTPLSGVLFAFPSRYWFTIGQSGVFSLGGWSPHVQSTFLVRRPTRFHWTQVSDTGLSPTMAALSRAFSYQLSSLRAGPRSLAATEGISVDFFSFGYLDVSVPRVRLLRPMYSVKGYLAYTRWVSPFGHRWIKVWLPTPQRFSQAPTSFIASNCQGIHRMRLVA